MAKPIDEIKRDISELGTRDRVALALSIIEDLDAGADTGVEEAWALEAERRWSEYKAGELHSSSMSEVLERARAALDG